MASLKSEIGGLVRIIRAFGWLFIIVGFLGLLAVFTTPAIEPSFESLSATITTLLAGALYLAIAEGLSKKKKWSWYLGIILFSFVAIWNFINLSTISLVAGTIALIFIGLLIRGKKYIFENQSNHEKDQSENSA